MCVCVWESARARCDVLCKWRFAVTQCTTPHSWRFTASNEGSFVAKRKHHQKSFLAIYAPRRAKPRTNLYEKWWDLSFESARFRGIILLVFVNFIKLHIAQIRKGTFLLSAFWLALPAGSPPLKILSKPFASEQHYSVRFWIHAEITLISRWRNRFPFREGESLSRESLLVDKKRNIIPRTISWTSWRKDHGVRSVDKRRSGEAIIILQRYARGIHWNETRQLPWCCRRDIRTRRTRDEKERDSAIGR